MIIRKFFSFVFVRVLVRFRYGLFIIYGGRGFATGLRWCGVGIGFRPSSLITFMIGILLFVSRFLTCILGLNVMTLCIC